MSPKSPSAGRVRNDSDGRSKTHLSSFLHLCTFDVYLSFLQAICCSFLESLKQLRDSATYLTDNIHNKLARQKKKKRNKKSITQSDVAGVQSYKKTKQQQQQQQNTPIKLNGKVWKKNKNKDFKTLPHLHSFSQVEIVTNLCCKWQSLQFVFDNQSSTNSDITISESKKKKKDSSNRLVVQSLASTCPVAFFTNSERPGTAISATLTSTSLQMATTASNYFPLSGPLLLAFQLLNVANMTSENIASNCVMNIEKFTWLH